MTWKLSNVSIPGLQNTYCAFVGYHNKTVQILGGDSSQQDLLEFPLDVAWNTSTTTSITFGYQNGQSSVQIDEQLWILPEHQQYLNVYDLKEKSIIQTISFPGTAAWGRCVTSSNEYVLVIGGYNNVNEFHIYNRLTTTWSTGTNLNNGRWGHSCNVIGDTIYIIGGSYIDSIEYLETNATSCCNGIWIEMNDRLSSGEIYHRSVVFEKLIYVIGGQDGNDNKIDQVDIIDTVSKTISSKPTNKLVYGKYCVSTILVQNIIYVFGGQSLTDNIHYQYASLIPTHNPHPTQSPSLLPTNVPSKLPTQSPSVVNTSQPTYVPSKIPTSSPTISSLPSTGVPSSAPTRCIDDTTLTNADCPDDPCAEKPYLDFKLSFSVCKKQPFVGNRYGLWDGVVNCLCDLAENGKYFDYSNPLNKSSDRRRLKRGNNECDLNVIKYGMDTLTEHVNTNCDTVGYRFYFGIEVCGECVTLTQTLKRLKDMTENEIYKAISQCSNWFAKRVDTVGFDGVYDLDLETNEEFGTECDIEIGGVNSKFYNAFIVIIVAMLLSAVLV